MKKDDSLRRWCAQLQDDDGIDPRRFFSEHGKGCRDRKTQQLCRQAFRILSILLPGESSSSLLLDLQVANVTPAPDSSRLLVRLHSPAALSPRQVEEILLHFEHAKGRLRTELAAAVSRKRAPDLVFQVVCGPGGAE